MYIYMYRYIYIYIYIYILYAYVAAGSYFLGFPAIITGHSRPMSRGALQIPFQSWRTMVTLALACFSSLKESISI